MSLKISMKYIYIYIYICITLLHMQRYLYMTDIQTNISEGSRSFSIHPHPRIGRDDLGRCEPTELLHAMQNVVAAEPQLRSSAFIWVYLRSVSTAQIPTALPGVLCTYPGGCPEPPKKSRAKIGVVGRGPGPRWGGTGRAVVACCSRVL